MNNIKLPDDRFSFTPTGLKIDQGATIKEWEECGKFLKTCEGAVQFWIGDWLNFGEQTYGNMYSEALDKTDYSYNSLKNCKWVASKVQLSVRTDNLSFQHHEVIASIPHIEQEKWLTRATENKWTAKELRSQLRQTLPTYVHTIVENIDGLKNGDCLELLTEIEDKSIDCVVTDPPYGIDYISHHRKNAYNAILNDKEGTRDLLDKSCALLKQKVKDDAHLYFFTSWKVLADFEEIISKYFEIKNVLIWVKNNWSMGDLDGNYAEQYEMIIFATNGRKILNGKRNTNILIYNRVSSSVHPTQKPVDLCRFLISKSSKQGEIVLDPFMGVGTSCIAAALEGRRFIGIEQDETYFNLAKKSLWELQKKE